jgi:hypothetical protein
MATKEKKRSPIRLWFLPVLFLLAAFPAFANIPRLAESRVWLPRDFAPLSIRAERDFSPETQGVFEGFNCELTLNPSIDPDGRLATQFGNNMPGMAALNGAASFVNNYANNSQNQFLGPIAAFAGQVLNEGASSANPGTYVNGAISFGNNINTVYQSGGAVDATSYALTSWNVGAVMSGVANQDQVTGQPVGDWYQRGTVISGGVAGTAGVASAGLSGLSALTDTAANSAPAQITLNRQAGLGFQQQVSSSLGATPAGSMVGTTLSGSSYTTIPDGILPNGSLLEVKNGAYVSYSPQLQAQVSVGQSTGVGNVLVVNPSSTVSQPVISAFGHTPANPTIFSFDPATSVLTPYP